jgi:RNA polymerase sigma-70 factor (ECF subfamily)
LNNPDKLRRTCDENHGRPADSQPNGDSASELSCPFRVYSGRGAAALPAGEQGAMSADASDLSLVRRVQRGDKGAFDALVLKYQHKVVKLVMRYVRNPAEAEDVAQEAFIKAYRALPQFRGDSAFYTWLYRIAINTAKNAVVSRDRSPVDYDLDLQNPDESYDMQGRLKDSETPEGLVLTDEIRGTVNSAIDALPEDLRTAIVLRELEGLSYEEIAATMECPVGTVRSRIFRAREAIDRRLREVFEGGLGRTEELG